MMGNGDDPFEDDPFEPALIVWGALERAKRGPMTPEQRKRHLDALFDVLRNEGPSRMSNEQLQK